jgi:pimeloyl-ACP methyl ester carboxylesterase
VVGVSAGGPHAIAAAARLGDRVARCGLVASPAPATAPDLDFLDGMSTETREEWLAGMRGAAALEADYAAARQWTQDVAGAPDPRTARLGDALVEGLRPGPEGFRDDTLALLGDWGFDLGSVTCPVRVMVARDDTDVPPGHGRWLAAHLRTAELLWVDGGHLGPREEPERALRWAGHGAR